MKIIRSKILLISILVAVTAGMGCTENSGGEIVYDELSLTELLANSSAYTNKHVCVEGEISDGLLDEKIKLDNLSTTLDEYRNAGIYAKLYGTFNDHGGAPALRVDHVEPVLTIAIENETYHSGETMSVNVTVFTEKEMPGVAITVSGITNKLDRNTINEVKYINLSQGENQIPFTFTTPACTRCAKLDPGLHNVTASILMNGETKSARISMILEK